MKVRRRQGSKPDPRKILEENRRGLVDMEGDLYESGIPFFEPDSTLNIDNDYIVLPEHITDVSNKELGEYLNAYTQQKVYMRTLLGHAELLCEEAKRKYELAGKDIYSGFSSTKMSEKSKDREVNMNPRVYPLFIEYSDLIRKCRILDLSISNIEDIIFMLSREVSRRGSDFDMESRNYNVNR